MENRSCQTNQILFIDEITSLIDKGNYVEVICLDFHKALDLLLHDILSKKLALCNNKAHIKK